MLATSIEGVRANEAIATGADRDQLLGQLGRMLASFHRTGRSDFGQVAANGWREPTARHLMTRLVAHQVDGLASQGLDDLARIARRVGHSIDTMLTDHEHAVLCHGDLHLENTLVVRSGGWRAVTGVVDYESAIYAFPEYDLAKSLVVCSALGDRDRAAVEHAYTRYGFRIRSHLANELVAFHAIEGWLHGATIERRDRDLWRSRLAVVLGAERAAQPSEVAATARPRSRAVTS